MENALNVIKDDISPEEKLVLIVDQAIIDSDSSSANIFLKRKNDGYEVSNTQPCTYGFVLQGQPVKPEKVYELCQTKGITCNSIATMDSYKAPVISLEFHKEKTKKEDIKGGHQHCKFASMGKQYF